VRAKILRGAVAILIAGTGVGLAVGSANAEKAAAALEAPDNADSSIPDPPPTASGAERRREQREPPYQRRQKWWTHARAVLFSDIELSAEQLRGVNEIFETQLADLERSGELKAQLKAARQQADAERNAAIRAESRALGARLKDPHECIEAMRALLSEEQRPSFDMNRARLFAEGDQPRKKRRRTKP
jgi:hypothetical protein